MAAALRLLACLALAPRLASSAACPAPATATAALTGAAAAAKPSAPTALTADRQQLTLGVARLSWLPPDDNGGLPITSYRVERRKVLPGTYLTQCAKVGDIYDEDFCVVGSFEAHQEGDKDVVVEGGQVEIWNGRISVRQVERVQGVQQVSCAVEDFGDPLYPTPPWVVARECYVVKESCVDMPLGWHDADGAEFDCAWYGALEGRCTAFLAAGTWARTAQQACCACGGGSRNLTLSTCAVEGSSCQLDGTIPSAGGTSAAYSDGVTSVYYGLLSLQRLDVASIGGSLACYRTDSPQLISVWTDLFCYVLEQDTGQWRDLMPANWTHTAETFDDMNVVQDSKYVYRVFAKTGATMGETNYSEELAMVLGGLPDAPPTTPMPTDFNNTIRLAWTKPPVTAAKVLGYRVYVDDLLKYDGSTNPDVLEYTLVGCETGGLYEFQVVAVAAAGETLAPPKLMRPCGRRPGRPQAPTVVTVNCLASRTAPDLNTITIRYLEPEINGGLPLSGWRVQRAQGASLAFRPVGTLFQSEDKTTFVDDNNLDGAGPIGLDYGETYKYRVVAVNAVDNMNDGDASDYVIARCV